MSKVLVRCIAVGLALLGLFSSSNLAVAKSDATTQLKQVLNSKGYMLASPAINWPYAGGFLVAAKDGATFIDLPSNIERPKGLPAQADFPAIKQSSKFSLTAVLTGMAALIGGNPGGGFGHSKTFSFQEVKAQGQRITYEQAGDILKDAGVIAQVSKWLSNPKQQVYIVGVVLTTSELSAASDSATNVDLSFNGSPLSKCTSSSSPATPATGSDPAASTPSAASQTGSGSANTSKKAANTPKAGATPAASTAATAAAGASSPGGELHFCYSSSNAVTMKTDTPLVFGAAAYKVTSAGGKLELQPHFSAGAGTIESTQATDFAKTAGAIPVQWKKEAWPGGR
jgi:hypothetical protein